MNAAVLGTGVVGASIGGKLVQLGHHTIMGSRTAANQKAAAWVKKNGPTASQGTFRDAAMAAEILFLCTNGEGTLEAVRSAGADALKGKVVVDITNPLDFSHGMPPSLLLCNTTSLGEEVQRAAPDALVVKTLNTVNCEVMVNPGMTGGEPTMFLCGNSAEAKATVRTLLKAFGWKDILDLGGITSARGLEMVLPLWVQTYMTSGNGYFGLKIIMPPS
jgi:predicted dinucleotide-binding enzyme